MQINFKIVIWIAAGVAAVLALSLGLYWYLHRSTTPTSNLSDTLPRGTVDSSTSGGGTVRPPTVETSGGEGAPASEPVLFQIHEKPIVSSVTFLRKTGPVVRFMEQGSGNVFEYDFVSKQKKRISNTSIPQIAQAVWSADGNVVAFQYMEDEVVHTAVGYFSSTSAEVEGPFEKIYFFPQGIHSLALSPDGSRLAYVTAIDHSGALFTARSDGSSPKLLFASPMTQWNISWPASAYLLVSSAYGDTGGITYKIDATSGSKTVLFSSPKVFEGVVGDSKGQFIAPNPQTGAISLYTPKFASFAKLSQPTWLDKCSLVQNATSTMVCAVVPTSVFDKYTPWLRGEFASNDVLVATNFTGESLQILIPETEFGDRRFDMENISVSPDKKYAVFKNRSDGSLWGVRAFYGIQ